MGLEKQTPFRFIFLQDNIYLAEIEAQFNSTEDIKAWKEKISSIDLYNVE